METLQEFLAPYLVSNIVFALVLAAAWFRPMWARIFLALTFLGASIFNSITALTTPDVYLEFGKVALVPFFRNFIYGFFSDHVARFVLLIALGQFLIFTGLVLNKTWTRIACAGGAIFGLALSALGVGSAFPATVLMALSFFILLLKPHHEYIWKWRQYHNTSSVGK